MRKYLVLLLLISVSGFSQSMSDYKYVIIPAKFSAQKDIGQFDLNELTRLFLQKNGYIAYLDSEILPVEVTKDNCNKTYLDVIENSTPFKTKLKVVIKDCTNKILFTSAEGVSAEKDNRVANNQALRAAFKSFDKPEYRYNPSAPTVVKTEMQPVHSQETVGISTETSFLSAQPIENGYQLVDTTPKIILKVYKTSNPEAFIAENNTAKGVLVKKGNQWFFEYYESGHLMSQLMNVRF